MATERNDFSCWRSGGVGWGVGEGRKLPRKVAIAAVFDRRRDKFK